MKKLTDILNEINNEINECINDVNDFQLRFAYLVTWLKVGWYICLTFLRIA